MPIIARNYRLYKQWKMPIITIGLKHHDRWYPVDAYVDSGAIYSIFADPMAKMMGLDIKKGKLIWGWRVHSCIPKYAGYSIRA